MRWLFILVAAAVMMSGSASGSDWGWGWVKNKTGFGKPTAEEVKADNVKLVDGDALVQKWADKLQPSPGAKIVRHEGLTEVDPWGKHVRLTYTEAQGMDKLNVRSAGPDGKFDTPDDLVRDRQAQADRVASHSSIWPYVGIWLVLGLVALGLRGVRRANKPAPVDHNAKKRGGFVSSSFILALGGASLAVYGVSTLGDILFGYNRKRRGWDCDCDCCEDILDCDSDCGGCDSDSPDCSCPDCSCPDCDCGGCDCDGCDCDCG